MWQEVRAVPSWGQPGPRYFRLDNGRDQPFDHHDANTLKFVAAPTLKPVSRFAEHTRKADLGFAAHERADMAMLWPLLLLPCFLFLYRKGGFRHGFEPSLRYRIAA